MEAHLTPTFTFFNNTHIPSQKERKQEESIVVTIKDVVKEVTGYSFNQYNNRSRKGEVMFARQLCQYLLKKYTKKSLKQISHIFLYKFKTFHHTTLMSNIDEVQYSLDIIVNTERKRMTLLALQRMEELGVITEC